VTTALHLIVIVIRTIAWAACALLGFFALFMGLERNDMTGGPMPAQGILALILLVMSLVCGLIGWRL